MQNSEGTLTDFPNLDLQILDFLVSSYLNLQSRIFNLTSAFRFLTSAFRSYEGHDLDGRQRKPTHLTV